MNPHLKKSVTLLELLIAIVLLSLIVISFTSIDLFSRFHVLTSGRRAKLQNEVSAALEHMTKQINRAIGYSGNWAAKAYSDNKGVRIRIDDNPANGRIDTSDHWIAYIHKNIGALATDSEIRFYSDAGEDEIPSGIYQSIAHKIVIKKPTSTFYGLEFSGNFVPNGWLNDNIIEVKITARWYPDQDASVDNPEVTMRTSIKMPSVSTN